VRICIVVGLAIVFVFGCVKKGRVQEPLPPPEQPALSDSTETTTESAEPSVNAEESTVATTEPSENSSADSLAKEEEPTSVEETATIEQPEPVAELVVEPEVDMATTDELETASNSEQPSMKQTDDIAAASEEPDTTQNVTFKRPESIVLDRQSTTLTSPRGSELWNDTSLSSRGLACASCHSNDSLYSAGFAEPYPHAVELVSKKTGVQSVDIDEMVNFCLTVSMQGSAMEWNSNDLLALTAEAVQRQKQYKEGLLPSLKNN